VAADRPPITLCGGHATPRRDSFVRDIMQLASTVLYTVNVQHAVDFHQRAFGCELRFLDLDIQLPLHVASHALGSLPFDESVVHSDPASPG
jgi:hypothetical protein